MPDYTLSDLTALTGISPRTIRYYIGQGLVPSPGREGPSTRYTETTLHRLRLIAKLRDAHLPLAAIRSQLAALDDSEVASLSGQPSGAAPESSTSALDYIRSVLGVEAPKPAPAVQMPPTPPTPPTPPRSAAGQPVLRRLLPRRELSFEPPPLLQEVEPPALLQEVESPAPPAPPIKPQPTTGERSQWERIAITTDIELHVRRPLTRADNRLVERLIAFARQLQEGAK